MSSTLRISRLVAALVATASVLASSALAAESDYQTHANWAELIAKNVLPADNTYGSDPTVVNWAGVNGASKYENRSVCAPFVTRTLKQAYSLTDANFKAWTGSTSPSAAIYHDLILVGNGFHRVLQADQILRGDIIAMKYLSCANQTNTGHVMIATGPAVKRVTDTAPIIPNTVQYEVPIVDSSNSDHFATGYADSRTDNAGNNITNGVGSGWFRIYKNALTGDIQGYSWSMKSGSVYYDMSGCRTIAVGRLY